MDLWENIVIEKIPFQKVESTKTCMPLHFLYYSSLVSTSPWRSGVGRSNTEQMVVFHWEVYENFKINDPSKKSSKGKHTSMNEGYLSQESLFHFGEKLLWLNSNWNTNLEWRYEAKPKQIDYAQNTCGEKNWIAILRVSPPDRAWGMPTPKLGHPGFSGGGTDIGPTNVCLPII